MGASPVLAAGRGRGASTPAGDWSQDWVPAEQEDQWLAAHRFGLDTALQLVSGMTALSAPHPRRA